MWGLEELKNYEMGFLGNSQEGMEWAWGSLRAAHIRIPFSGEFSPGGCVGKEMYI